MKRISVFMLLLLISNFLFAVELWNGFTSDMTMESAILRAREVLNLSAEPRINNNDGHAFFRTDALSKDYPIPYNFPQMVYLRSKMEGLYNEGSNIILALYDNKLFAIKVYWAANPQDLLKLGTQNFGESKLFRYTGRSSTGNWVSEFRLWTVGGRDIFWGDGDVDTRRNGKYFLYIDQQSQRNYNEKLQIEEQKRAAERERQRQEDASKVKL